MPEEEAEGSLEISAMLSSRRGWRNGEKISARKLWAAAGCWRTAWWEYYGATQVQVRPPFGQSIAECSDSCEMPESGWCEWKGNGWMMMDGMNGVDGWDG